MKFTFAFFVKFGTVGHNTNDNDDDDNKKRNNREGKEEDFKKRVTTCCDLNAFVNFFSFFIFNLKSRFGFHLINQLLNFDFIVN
jgi:hypothetical protein